jgi:hypothetical protein
VKRQLPIVLSLISTLIVILSCSDALAQKGINKKGSGGWGRESAYSRMYDVNTEETLVGTVTKVEKITPTRGMSCGVHLIVETEQETLSVHLGPAWFIDNQDIIIEQNDELEIKGSRIEFEGKPAIIAALVEKGDKILTLRDEIGVPVWSGWRRRR